MTSENPFLRIELLYALDLLRCVCLVNSDVLISVIQLLFDPSRGNEFGMMREINFCTRIAFELSCYTKFRKLALFWYLADWLQLYYRPFLPFLTFECTGNSAVWNPTKKLSRINGLNVFPWKRIWRCHTEASFHFLQDIWIFLRLNTRIYEPSIQKQDIQCQG